MLQGENDLAAWVGKRVDMLLQQSIKMNLRTKADCLGFLGSYFRDYFGFAETADKDEAAVSLPADLIVTVHPPWPVNNSHSICNYFGFAETADNSEVAVSLPAELIITVLRPWPLSNNHDVCNYFGTAETAEKSEAAVSLPAKLVVNCSCI